MEKRKMKVERISDTLHVITFSNGCVLTLVGTAHVSAGSVDLVKDTIEKTNPDRICIELDATRLRSKEDKKNWESMDIGKVLKEGKGFFLLANTALASFQKRMGGETGVKPGEEILSAARIASEKNIPLTLADREIQTTFRRAWAKSGLWNKVKLLATLVSAAFSNESLSEEELEALKKEDSLESMMNEMAKELPTVKEVLIDERDRYIATKIYQAEGCNKVAIIGAGHTKGIINTLEKLEKGEIESDVSKLDEIPKGKSWGKLFSFLIPALIILIVVVSVLLSGWEQGLRAFLMWIAACSSMTLLASLVSLAHPLNMLLCAITAPFFTLNPVLGVGMLGGWLEAKFRKPRVRDFENMSGEAMTIKGWYKNKILHALLVFLATSIGSMLGTFIVFPVLLSII